MQNEEQARKQLETILNGKEYQVYYEDNRSLIERLWDNFLMWLEENLNWSAPLGTSNGIPGFILIGMIVIVVIVLFFILLKKRMEKRTFQLSQPLQRENELNWSFHKHLQEAEKQENEGNYSLATRHLFLAFLLYFHEREWVVAKIWKTNWEYYEELKKENNEVAKLFQKLALLFDQATYGEKDVKKEQYLLFRDEVVSWIKES